LQDAGRLNEAETAFRDSVSILRKLSNPERNWYLAGALDGLGNLLLSQDRLAEAENAFRESFTIRRIVYGDNHSDSMAARNSLAAVLRREGKRAEAAALVDEDPFVSGLDYARHGQFNEATTDFAKAVEKHPDDRRAWHYQAVALVQSGQIDAYRELRRKSLQRFERTADPFTAEQIAKDYLILPSDGPGLESAAALANNAISANTNASAMPWFWLTKGLAEYRQGHFASSVDWMQQVLSKVGHICERDAAAWAVLALAQQRLNQTNEASVALAKGFEIVDSNLPNLGSRDLGAAWLDATIARALLDEAKALLESSPAKPQE
jgi:tetratricopeptide (TPR) repeat protein